MDLMTTQTFRDFHAGVEEALAELNRLSRYCADTIAVAPDGALKTVEDLEGRIKDAADLIHAHFTLFRHDVGKVRPQGKTQAIERRPVNGGEEQRVLPRITPYRGRNGRDVSPCNTSKQN